MGDRLTKRTVDAAKAPSAGEAFIWDGELKGFGLRVTSNGAKSYVIQTRPGGGRGTAKRFTIGKHGSPWTPDTARQWAEELLTAARKGVNPTDARRAAQQVPTLREFTEKRYLPDHAEAHKRDRTVDEDRRNLKLHIWPQLGGKRLTEINHADAVRFHTGMKDTPIAANRCAALLSHVYTIAAKWGEIPEGLNPFRKIDKYPETQRQRFLNGKELARLGDALAALEAEEPPSAIAAVRLLVLTGARLSEILTLEWSMVDYERRCLHLAKSKTGRKDVQLGAPALQVLRGLSKEEENPYVLPGHRRGQHFVGIQYVWQRVRKRAKLPDVRLHDLRHSFASVAVAGGDSLFLVGKVLGHRQNATTERYAHVASDPLRAVADRTARHISNAMQGRRARRGKVLKIGKRAAPQ